MKKLFYLLLFLPIFSISQNNNTVSIYYSLSQPEQLGISYEFKLSNKQKNNTSKFINLSYSAQGITYSDGLSNSYTLIGSGFAISYGERNYFGKEKKNFYYENSLEYSKINFNDKSTGFNGTYSYFTMFNPNIGYKWFAGKKFIIDPYIGFNWKWQIRGQGNIDNNIFNPLVFRVGVKVGYNF